MKVSIEQASGTYAPGLVRVASAVELVQGNMFSATFYDRYNNWMTYFSGL